MPLNAWERAVLRAAVAPAAVLAAHLALRAAFGDLGRLLPLNIATHVAGGLAVAHLFTAAVAPVADAFSGRARRLVVAVGVFALTTTTAVAWEFFECVVARVCGVRGPSAGGDTLQDVAAGMLGAAAFVVHRLARGSARECRTA